MALTRRAIVEAGLEILDEYGLADLTMRRVADALGVQAGALYYHVPNKQSLLAAVADEVLSQVRVPSDDSVPGWVVRWAWALREALLVRRDAAELVASTQALGLGADACAPARRFLASAGVPEPDATAEAMLHVVLGHVTQEQTRAQMRELGVRGDDAGVAPERSFEWGVRLIAAGIAATS